MGVFYFLKKQLQFALQDRLGLLLVTISIFGSWYVFYYEQDAPAAVLDVDSPEILVALKQLDSFDSLQVSKAKFTMYLFNPNFITDFKGYQLGMSVSQIDALFAYRQQGKWINSIADFKKVTGISDSLLATISPFFKFPTWVTNPKPTYQKKDYSFKGPKANLNMATAEEFEAVYGIGPTISKRIVALRERLKGFSDTLQLRAVYGLNDATRKRLLERFILINPKKIKKIIFAKASASDLATIPGISFDLAVTIINYRRLRDGALVPTDLLKIDGLSPQKLELITLYLQFN